MRTYPINSPEAAARVLALALLADGHCSLSELEALDRTQAARTLGLSEAALRGVLLDVCEDLLAAHRGRWTGSFQALDAGTWSALLSEVTHPGLQRSVLVLCDQMAQADGHLTADEACLLEDLRRAWGPAEQLQAVA